jgi:hypothetical protein
VDFAVALECYPPLFLTKTYTDEKGSPRAYDNAQNFRFEIIPIADLADLAEMLTELDGEPRKCLVRGAVRGDVDPTQPIWRRLWRVHPDAAPNAAPLLDADHCWACLDIDRCDAPFDLSNPRVSIEAWRATQPAELRNAGMVFQLSSRAHQFATLRGHAWVWLSQPASDTQVKRWAVAHGFDGSLYSPEHIHYTGAPRFASGEDPLRGRRLHWFDGETVELPALTDDALAVVPVTPLAGAVSIDASYLAAGHAILGAIGSAGGFDGRKFWMTGALAGLLRRAGWPEEVALALIETWLTGHAEDMQHGLDWARQAWRKNADAVSGAAKMREFIAPAAADLVSVLACQPMRSRIEALRAPPPRVEWGEQEDEFGRVIQLLDEPPSPTYRVTEFEWGLGRPFGLMAVNNAGKTLLSRQMLLQYALGVPLLGRFAIGEQTSGRVLDLCYEQASQAAYTWSRLAKGMSVSIERLGDRIVCRAPSRLLSEGLGRFQRDPETLRNLEDWLCRLCDGFDLASVDPVSAALLGVDENSSQLQEPVRMLERVSLRTGCAMMIVVHMGRSGDHARGHSSLEDALDVSAHLLPTDKDKEDNHRVLKCVKRVRKGWQDCSLEISDTPNGGVLIRAVGTLSAEPEAHIAAHRILRFVQRNPGVPYGVTQLKQSCSISSALWPNAINAAETAGLTRRSGPKGSVVWLWIENAPA